MHTTVAHHNCLKTFIPKYTGYGARVMVFERSNGETRKVLRVSEIKNQHGNYIDTEITHCPFCGEEL